MSDVRVPFGPKGVKVSQVMPLPFALVLFLSHRPRQLGAKCHLP